ncbi:MAG: hypothetical protein IBJ11_10215 [Phycisphaerales bacterium]|nr:hypothetical protein [Phycisphaerales bacterium]
MSAMVKSRRRWMVTLAAAAAGLVGLGAAGAMMGLASPDASTGGGPVVGECEGPAGKVTISLTSGNLNIVIGGRRLVLEAMAWRNTQPSTLPDPDRGLNVTARLRSSNGRFFPLDAEVVRLRVTQGAEAWESGFPGDTPVVSDRTVERTARRGPSWTPGSSVSVEAIVRVGGRRGTLRVDNVPISRAQ